MHKLDAALSKAG